MKRISVEQVKAAYEAQQLSPIRMRFGDGCNTACPLVALFLNDGNEEYRGSPLIGDKAFTWAPKVYSDLYACGFAEAWDGDERDRECKDKQEYQVGYADGLAVREAIVPSPPPTPGESREP